MSWLQRRISTFAALLLASMFCVAGCFVGFVAGCGGEEPLPTRDQLFNDEMSLPTLYITASSGQHVSAPASKGVFVDEASGEVAWPAMACHNPDCPGKGLDGELFLFIIPLPGGPQATSTAAVDPAKSAPQNSEGHCPQCLKIRRLSNEPKELTQNYVNWVRPHVLPEAAEQRKKIEEARRARANRKRTR